jgi:hypothetical protein
MEETMTTNINTRGGKVRNLIFGTVGACFAVPLLAAVVLPPVFVPILALTVPFLAAGFLEYRLENLGIRVEPNFATARVCAATVHA